MPAVLLAAGIAVASLWENPHAIMPHPMSDKTLHAILYALFAMTLIGGFLRNHSPQWSADLWVTLIATSYGALMEALQMYCTRTRSGEWKDVLADFIGAALGVILIELYTILKKRYLAKKA